MESRTHSPGGSSRPKLCVKPPITIMVENYDDEEIVQHRCVILTGKCGPILSKAALKILVTCLDASRQAIQKLESRELSDTGEFNIPLLLSYGRNDITLTPYNTSASLTLCLIYIPPQGAPVIQLVALIASDSPHRPVNKKKKAENEKKTEVPWSFSKSSNRLRTTAYMCQAFIAEEMKRHNWGPRTFHLKEDWNETNKKYIEPEVRRIYTDKTVAQIQAAEIERNNGVVPHEDGWVQILSDELSRIDEYNIPNTIVVGIVMDSIGPLKDNFLRDIQSSYKTTPNGLSLAVCGGIQTHYLPPVLSDFETIHQDEIHPLRTFIQYDGTSTSICDLEAASISQLSILNALLHALGMLHPFHAVTPQSALSWAGRFRAPVGNILHWHLLDVETLSLSPYITLTPSAEHAPPKPTYRIIHGRGYHPAITTNFPVLLIESVFRISRIMTQGGSPNEYILPASRAPGWEPVFCFSFPMSYFRRHMSDVVDKNEFDFHEPLRMRVEAVNGTVLEIADVWKLDNGWMEDLWEKRAREEREERELVEVSGRVNGHVGVGGRFV